MIPSNLRTLGPLEAKVVLSLRERGSEAVDVSDIRSLAGPGTATRNVIQQLIRKGWLSRVRRGRYVLLPPEYGPDNLGENNVLALATAAVTPSYVAWWSAASFHGFTTQIPLTAFIAVTGKMSEREPRRLDCALRASIEAQVLRIAALSALRPTDSDLLSSQDAHRLS